MFRRAHSLAIAGLAALVGVFLAALPLQAGPIGFRNDTKNPIKVQGMSVINGIIRQGKCHTIEPGATAWDTIIAPGNKIIIVTDAKQPTKTLVQETIQVGAGTVFYSIQPKEDPAAKAGVKPAKEKNAAKVKLVPTMPPAVLPRGVPASPPRR
jgi:hypothetical protein